MSDAAGGAVLVFAPTMDCSGAEEGAEACRKKPPLPEVGQDQNVMDWELGHVNESGRRLEITTSFLRFILCFTTGMDRVKRGLQVA